MITEPEKGFIKTTNKTFQVNPNVHLMLSFQLRASYPICSPQSVLQLHGGRRGIIEQHFPFTSRRLIIKDQPNPYT